MNGKRAQDRRQQVIRLLLLRAQSACMQGGTENVGALRILQLSQNNDFFQSKWWVVSGILGFPKAPHSFCRDQTVSLLQGRKVCPKWHLGNFITWSD